MTKPKRLAQRADDWTFDMSTGWATHAPTGLEIRLYPHWHAVIDNPLQQLRTGEQVPVEGVPWTYLGMAVLPDGVPDRRPPGFPGPGDANDRGLGAWAILARPDALQAALNALTLLHGPAVAKQIMGGIGREAGERWIFRARLERGWTTGNRAT